MQITPRMGTTKSVRSLNKVYLRSLHQHLCSCLTDLTKHFWTYKHFGNFVKRKSHLPALDIAHLRPSDHCLSTAGSQRNIVTGDDASNTTLVVSTSDSYHVLAMNPATDPVNATLTFPDVVCATTAVRTSSDEDFATVDPATEATNGTWVLALAATSLTTFTFERGAC